MLELDYIVGLWYVIFSILGCLNIEKRVLLVYWFVFVNEYYQFLKYCVQFNKIFIEVLLYFIIVLGVKYIKIRKYMILFLRKEIVL